MSTDPIRSVCRILDKTWLLTKRKISKFFLFIIFIVFACLYLNMVRRWKHTVWYTTDRTRSRKCDVTSCHYCSESLSTCSETYTPSTHRRCASTYWLYSYLTRNILFFTPVKVGHVYERLKILNTDFPIKLHFNISQKPRTCKARLLVFI